VLGEGEVSISLLIAQFMGTVAWGCVEIVGHRGGSLGIHHGQVLEVEVARVLFVHGIGTDDTSEDSEEASHQQT
jgi:hypothetical protein